LVGEKLAALKRAVDVIVLAQASMARVVAEIPPGERTIPILSSPELAVSRAAEVIAAVAQGGTPEPGATPGTAGAGACQ
jgi:hypothetical protein